MKITVIVNDVRALEEASTTVHLTAAAVARGWDVTLTDVRSLCAVDGQVLAWARDVSSSDTADATSIWLHGEPKLIFLSDADVVLSRTNPSNDPGYAALHNVWLSIAFVLEDAGVLMLNSPRGLARGGSKALQLSLDPQLFPRTALASTPEAVPATNFGTAVVKPAHGSRGRGVALVDTTTADALAQELENIRPDALIIQEQIAEAKHGDVRLLMVDGAVLQASGRIAAVSRRPAPGEFRSNVHLGGTVEPAILSTETLAAAASVGERLKKWGLFFVGLDFVGDKLLELNVFSPGGLPDAERLEAAPFTERFFEVVEEALARRAR